MSDVTRLSGADDFAQKSIAERKRSTRQLDARLNLANDLDHLAAVVVQAKDEASCVYDSSQLRVQHAEQLLELGRLGQRLLHAAHHREARLAAIGRSGSGHRGRPNQVEG